MANDQNECDPRVAHITALLDAGFVIGTSACSVYRHWRENHIYEVHEAMGGAKRFIDPHAAAEDFVRRWDKRGGKQQASSFGEGSQAGHHREDPRQGVRTDSLHPYGRCTCFGEGECEWCLRTAGDGG